MLDISPRQLESSISQSQSQSLPRNAASPRPVRTQDSACSHPSSILLHLARDPLASVSRADQSPTTRYEEVPHPGQQSLQIPQDEQQSAHLAQGVQHSLQIAQSVQQSLQLPHAPQQFSHESAPQLLQQWHEPAGPEGGDGFPKALLHGQPPSTPHPGQQSMQLPHAEQHALQMPHPGQQLVHLAQSSQQLLHDPHAWQQFWHVADQHPEQQSGQLPPLVGGGGSVPPATLIAESLWERGTRTGTGERLTEGEQAGEELDDGGEQAADEAWKRDARQLPLSTTRRTS
uniref:Flavohemoglobin n=1 Tax=Ganoderma boninense TaxID=34458 RepID=A0A5K1JUS2_9APHY|nr:Flavohemoglobin [Ganoderma boninense]